MITIENRKYNQDNTSKEEIAEINKRTEYIDSNIILIKEMSIPSAYVHQLFFEKLNRIIKANDNFYLIVDLTEVKTKIPGVDVRAKIRQNIEYYRNRIIHGCVIVGSNFFMKFAANLTLRRQIKSISIHSNISEAKEKITFMKKQAN